MNNIDDLLKNSYNEKIEIPSKINYRINYTLNNLNKPKYFSFYIKKFCAFIIYLILILFSGVSVYAAFGGTINGENIFEWIGINVSNQQFNESKKSIGEQIYSNDGTNVTLESTFYDGNLAILEFTVILSEKDSNYLKINQNVVTDDYIHNDSIQYDIDVTIDGNKLTSQEIKELQIEQHKDEKIDKIWLSLNNKELFDKEGNSYIEGTYNNNSIIINNKEYYLRHNAQQIVDKINEYEYRIFQTYFLPQEDYTNDDTLNLKISNMEIIANKTQLGDTQKRIHLLDNYEVEMKKNVTITNKDNIETTTLINTNKNISQTIDYVAISPVQTTIKISTKLNNVNYNDFVDLNNENYIGELYYEVYDENNIQLSSYKVETKRKIIYSNGETEELEIDSFTPSKYFENADIELTQYLVCENSSNNFIIDTINANKNLLNKLNVQINE